MSEDPLATNFYMNLMQKIAVDIDFINGIENEKKESELSDYFYDLMKPIKFWGTNGKEVTYFKAFESNCNAMRQNGVPDPKKLPARTFFQYQQELTKQYRKRNGR